MPILETTYLIIYKWINQSIPTFLKVDDALTILVMSFLAFMNFQFILTIFGASRDFPYLPLYLTYGVMVFFYFKLLRNHKEILSSRSRNDTKQFRWSLMVYILGTIICFVIPLL